MTPKKLVALAGMTAVVLAAAFVTPANAGVPTPAPEIDPSVVRGGLTLLVSGVLMLGARFRGR